MLLGLVLENQAFQQPLCELLVFVVELLECLELEFEQIVGAAFVLVEGSVSALTDSAMAGKMGSG